MYRSVFVCVCVCKRCFICPSNISSSKPYLSILEFPNPIALALMLHPLECPAGNLLTFFLRKPFSSKFWRLLLNWHFCRWASLCFWSQLKSKIIVILMCSFGGYQESPPLHRSPRPYKIKWIRRSGCWGLVVDTFFEITLIVRKILFSSYNHSFKNF